MVNQKATMGSGQTPGHAQEVLNTQILTPVRSEMHLSEVQRVRDLAIYIANVIEGYLDNLTAATKRKFIQDGGKPATMEDLINAHFEMLETLFSRIEELAYDSR